jgi:hypothetical protein
VSKKTREPLAEEPRKEASKLPFPEETLVVVPPERS